MTLPEILQSPFEFNWNRFLEACPEDLLGPIKQCLAEDNRQQQLETCWAGSDFAAELCSRHPQWLLDLLQSTDLDQYRSLEHYSAMLVEALKGIENQDDLFKTLRVFRNQSMLRIIWRDFTRLANTKETTAELSFLADVCIIQAQAFLHAELVKIYGEPLSSTGSKKEEGEERSGGEPQQMLVIAMGKHGANELNLSSDIDLIFAYPEKGNTANPDKRISNQEFFIKLGQHLIRALDQVTADGFVFRVDMRLRPYGESGALVSNFDAMEDYYQKQGRSWERYAMIKARVVTGDPLQKQRLVDMLMPFTFRRYIDFSAIESLRDMKAMISREVKRKGYENNIKLGAGGIREVEFIVQVFQLIRGGREADLQQRELLNILPLLEEKQLLPAEVVAELQQAYLFLRDVEHAIQGYQDKQTQLLPGDEKSLERIRFIMGFDSTDTFIAQLEAHRDNVKEHFKNIIASGEEEEEQVPVPECLVTLWEYQSSDETGEKADEKADEKESIDEELQILLQHYDNINEEEHQKILGGLRELKTSKTVLSLQTESRKRLDTFIPLLLNEIFTANIDNYGDTFLRILPLVQTVLRRSAYLLLLIENLHALKELVTLSSASPWIAEELSHHPVLLDELLDARTLFALPPREKLQDDLRQEVMRIPWDDLEAHMEVLRHFKQVHRLRVAACEVTGRLPLMKVSDYLTFLAEVILQHAVAAAWHYMTQRHGYPVNKDGSVAGFDGADPSFIIIAYGKMGGLELGHNSDLDVVFLHGVDTNSYTNGDRSIDNATFYMRLGQRIIHILETRTPSGQLYEVDTRLRPSGNSGMLVSTIKGFEKYQHEKAWTWEHQALVRARIVYGEGSLAEEFEAIRRKVLCLPREDAPLKKDVIEMRQKMRLALGTKPAKEGTEEMFHLKQDAGGIVDIEFMVQYAVLHWAAENPDICRWTDNIRILEDLGEMQLIAAKDTQQLIESYKMLRCAAHRQALQQQGNTLAAEPFREARDFIRGLWQQLLC